LSMCVHGLGIGSVVTVPEEDRMGEKCDVYIFPYPPGVGYWFSSFLLWEQPGCSASPDSRVKGLVWISVVPLPGLWPQGSTFDPIRSCLGIEDHSVLSEVPVQFQEECACLPNVTRLGTASCHFLLGRDTKTPCYHIVSYYISQFLGCFFYFSRLYSLERREN
jgi:hypothetical protein